MQVTDKIRSQLGSWVELFTPFIQSEQWDKIFTTLKTLSMNKRTVIPKSPDVFKSFELCDRHKIKAVIFLMDPYPSTTKEGEIIADGVPMSCKNTGKMQPTLELWYEGMEQSIVGFDPDFEKRLDTSYLLSEEGVLLLNSCLTCEKDKPGSHIDLWTPFMKFFIEEILNKYYSGLPIVLLGAQAQKLERYIAPMLHHTLKAEHPVAASYGNRAWKHEEMFTWCNRIIEAANGPEAKIRWYRKKGEDQPIEWEEKRKPYSSNKEPLKSAEELNLPWKD